MRHRSFFVSHSGDDSNDGLSQAAPWKTLRRVSGQVFGPGDSILLQAGDVWEEAVEIKGQGEPQNPIVFSSYGGSEKPILRYGRGDVVKAFNPSHLVIQGLHIQCTTELPLFPEAERKNFDRQDGKYPLNRGILIEFDCSVLCSGIVIADNIVSGPGVDSFTEGIIALVRYPSTPGALSESVVSDLQFLRNQVHGVGWIGLTTSGARSGVGERQWFPQFLFRDVKMLHNVVFEIGVQGLMLFHGQDSVMKWNTVHHAGMYAGPGVQWSPCGLWVWSSRRVELMFNEVYEMQDSSSGKDGTGFDIDWHSEEIRVQHNHAHDNHGNGIATMACRNCEISGNRVEGNRGLFNCGKGQIALTNWHQDQSDDRITSVENLNLVDNLILLDRKDTGALNAWKSAPGPEWSGNTFAGNRIVLKPGITPAFVYDLPPDTAVDRIADNRLYGFPDALAHLGQESDRRLEIVPHSPIVVRNLSGAYDADSGQVALSWDVDQTARSHVHHFNVHRSSTPQLEPKYTNMVGQAKGFAFTDEVDLDDRSAYYVVQAEDLTGDYGPAAEIEIKP